MLNVFDKTMFYLYGSSCQAVYYLIIFHGPVEISKVFTLKEGKRIFALLLCFIGGIKLALEGIFIVTLATKSSKWEFLYQRLLDFILITLAIIGLFPMIRDENDATFKKLLGGKTRQVSPVTADL